MHLSQYKLYIFSVLQIFQFVKIWNRKIGKYNFQNILSDPDNFDAAFSTSAKTWNNAMQRVQIIFQARWEHFCLRKGNKWKGNWKRFKLKKKVGKFVSKIKKGNKWTLFVQQKNKWRAFWCCTFTQTLCVDWDFLFCNKTDSINNFPSEGPLS